MKLVSSLMIFGSLAALIGCGSLEPWPLRQGSGTSGRHAAATEPAIEDRAIAVGSPRAKIAGGAFELVHSGFAPERPVMWFIRVQETGPRWSPAVWRSPLMTTPRGMTTPLPPDELVDAERYEFQVLVFPHVRENPCCIWNASIEAMPLRRD